MYLWLWKIEKGQLLKKKKMFVSYSEFSWITSLFFISFIFWKNIPNQPQNGSWEIQLPAGKGNKYSSLYKTAFSFKGIYLKSLLTIFTSNLKLFPAEYMYIL